MGKSYGFVEITGVVAAIDALDIMCKTSGVTLETWERKLGGRLATIIVSGDVASVKEAVEAANTQGIKKPVASGIIASPHMEVQRLVELSASRFRTAKTDIDKLTATTGTPAERTAEAAEKAPTEHATGQTDATGTPAEAAANNVKEPEKEALKEKKNEKKNQKKHQKKQQSKR